jgi:hypothetical protein
MKITLNIVCRIANNIEQQIIFDINDEILKVYDISDYDELLDLIESKTERWYEYNEEWENLGG